MEASKPYVLRRQSWKFGWAKMVQIRISGKQLVDKHCKVRTSGLIAVALNIKTRRCGFLALTPNVAIRTCGFIALHSHVEIRRVGFALKLESQHNITIKMIKFIMGIIFQRCACWLCLSDPMLYFS